MPEVYTVTVTRCDQCRSILEAADNLLMAMPEVRQRIGSREIAQHRVSAALYALDALGVKDAGTIDRLTATARDIRMLIAGMTSVGVATMWVRRYSPFKAATSKASGSGRWAHVGEAARQELRDAYVALMAQRVDTPIPISPPEGYVACMLCGVGAFRAPRSAADSLWMEQSASARSLGGAPSSELIYGVTCPPCSHAIWVVGAVGEPAMSRAVVKHLGMERVNLGMLELENLRGWAALGYAAKPNRDPWAHLSFARLREA
ncbi:hypothetical protein KZX37_08315 [Microbacterium sp. EYE_5]|uniref:hypothetical protein n=1 Tax=unclassified Microbacterium TaxID=2609290 RepID=UPI002006646C|nr:MULTISPECIES: hypothetical protein [unclassified Microbacterium]MCK6081482.1 hypothetical protein [Microbacterium sp. EYE_382]MCK6123750.1 hypothetical protein [Microbacterium sp. EYE_80]MCK6126659.1 hypothetical protein [Microbacterium sp. EYE_79]MCK6142437.1 hypothetical protein [Microbacterium sp. EYE_39]MCK6218305.1 hypothetical protein [Microbacterium sp. EYE_5]